MMSLFLLLLEWIFIVRVYRSKIAEGRKKVLVFSG